MIRMDADTFLDATHKGNVARFINHSCTPNCYRKTVRAEEKRASCTCGNVASHNTLSTSGHGDVVYGNPHMTN